MIVNQTLYNIHPYKYVYIYIFDEYINKKYLVVHVWIEVDNKRQDVTVNHDDVIKWKHFRVTGSLCGEFSGHTEL